MIALDRLPGVLAARALLGGDAALILRVEGPTPVSGHGALLFLEERGVAKFVARLSRDQLASASVAFDVAAREIAAREREAR